MTTDMTKTIWLAAIDTIEDIGPLPDRIEDMPNHIQDWQRLMRDRDPSLRTLTDAQIAAGLAVLFDELATLVD